MKYGVSTWNLDGALAAYVGVLAVIKGLHVCLKQTDGWIIAKGEGSEPTVVMVVERVLQRGRTRVQLREGRCMTDLCDSK